MQYLKPDKVHIKWLTPEEELPLEIRKYTLTHSDLTGNLFLSIGKDYDYEKIKKFYIRLMRDEVLAEWKKKREDQLELHIHVHVSGGFCFGTARFRDKILRHHLPSVIELFKYVESTSKESPIYVHFNSKREKYDKIELWNE
ncbi:MAG: hypothetical protein EU547_04975 [Promethearchaeota archaeon]|nr:MAG: hypothetical protein EU547_04975 [Candidatus Lokiarchaeota archaeon]